MKKGNNKGFLLLELMVAFALLVSMAAIISWYCSALAKQHCTAKRHLNAFRLLQQRLYEDAVHTARAREEVEVRSAALPPFQARLQSRGYTQNFHKNLVIKKAWVAWHSDQGARSIGLETICLRKDRS